MTTDEPAVNGWQAATEAHMATSAIGRALQEQLGQLREEYNAVVLDRDETRAALQQAERERDSLGRRCAVRFGAMQVLRTELRDALDANAALSFDLAAAIIANDRLTRENERLRAATQTTEEQP